MEGLKLAAAYSWNCQTAEKLKISQKLFDFASGKTQNNQVIKKILATLGPYKEYLAIAKIKHLTDEFSSQVVMGYWRNRHNRAVLVPLYHLPPDKINLKHINECFVAGGKIKSISKNCFIVERRPIIRKKNSLVLGKLTRKKAANSLNLKVKIDDFVSFHYSNAVEIISYLETKKLTETTEKILREFNAKRK